MKTSAKHFGLVVGS